MEYYESNDVLGFEVKAATGKPVAIPFCSDQNRDIRQATMNILPAKPPID